MFIGETIIYPDLQKTGSTHLRRLLMSLPSEQGRKYRKHTPLHEIPLGEHTGFQSKTKIGSIRSPWDWYVSLWAYGCAGKGDIHRKTTRFEWAVARQRRSWHYPFIPRRRWRAAYAELSPECFKAWLRLVFSPSRKHDLGEYGRSPISRHAGLFTYRYLRLHTLDFQQHYAYISAKADITDWDEQRNFLDYTIRQEQLNADFLVFIKERGIPPSPKTLQLLQQQSNTSEHQHYSHYYDDESQVWIKDKEWFILEKYDYDFNQNTVN